MCTMQLSTLSRRRVNGLRTSTLFMSISKIPLRGIRGRLECQITSGSNFISLTISINDKRRSTRIITHNNCIFRLCGLARCRQLYSLHSMKLVINFDLMQNILISHLKHLQIYRASNTLIASNNSLKASTAVFMRYVFLHRMVYLNFLPKWIESQTTLATQKSGINCHK